ncbi:MAG TPA: DUF2267 domain-containing protein [Enhygromyxa sp.]|nr:DUF2267 domain-containing protein [Enhygromyxa sp.]
MSPSNVPSLNRSIHKTQLWLKELTDHGHLDNEQQAYSVLRAVLHALRDRLTIDEAANFAAQLPMIIRGVYYEGWRPSAAPIKYKDRSEFYERIRHELRDNAAVDVAHATDGVFALLSAKITAGEMANLREMMPADLRLLWPQQTTQTAPS